MTAAEPALRAVGVWKRYHRQQGRPTSLKERLIGKRSYRAEEEFWPLRDVSFDLPRGGSIGLVGHNGAGKTTALKVLAGVYRPTKGHLEINGRVQTLIELGAGFHPELTGRENIRLAGAILGMSSREVAQRMDQIIDFSGIEDFIDDPIKVYSSGMRIRLMFAVTTTTEPDLLMVDEILAVGDERFKAQCAEYMKSIRERGAAMLMASHSMPTIREMCEETIWLDHGSVRMMGPTDAVVEAYVAEMKTQSHSVTR